ncbi:MAG TPA: L,D-transpeptidase family protein [Candidatus Eisenbacteria bacterium]
MNSQAGYTIEGIANSARPRTASSGRSRWPVIALGTLALLVGAINAYLWLAGSGRAGAAVAQVEKDAATWRESWATQQAPPPAKGKKSSKGKNAKSSKTPGMLAVGPLPSGDAPIEEINSQAQDLEGQLARYQPDGVFIVIDTANNKFLMRDGADTLLNTDCSTGSYSSLTAADGRKWFFHTPRGQFKIQNKKQKPVWVKPDWAFVETNEPIPSARAEERYEPYVMGDYAMGFGNGYYIHGTLYGRLIGQSVTHGCVRLLDAPLEQVYNTAPIGTPIFIY